VKQILIDVAKETYDSLDRHAKSLGLRLSEYVSAEVERLGHTVLAGPPDQWMPQDRWDQLVRGSDCLICADLQTNERVNEEGFIVVDLQISRLRLMKNQFVSGYCVLFCKKHVREPFELDPEEQRLFFDELMRVGRALDEVFAPAKMNFEILGNQTPHLHCHVKPRMYGDPAPGIPINSNAYTHHLEQKDYEDLIRKITDSVSRSG